MPPYGLPSKLKKPPALPELKPEPEPEPSVELTGNAGVDKALAALAALTANTLSAGMASAGGAATDGPHVKRGRGRPPKSAEEKALTVARRKAKNELLKLERKSLKGQQKAAKVAALSGNSAPKKPKSHHKKPSAPKDECKTCTRNWHTAHTCGKGRTDNPHSKKHPKTTFSLFAAAASKPKSHHKKPSAPSPFAAAAFKPKSHHKKPSAPSLFAAAAFKPKSHHKKPSAPTLFAAAAFKPKSHHKKPSAPSPVRLPSGADRTVAAGGNGKVGRPKKSDRPLLSKQAASLKTKMKPKWFRCDFCKKRFKSLSLQKEHKRVHELEWESQAIEQRLMGMRQGKLRGLNKKFTNRRMVLVASPLSFEGGTG